MAAARNCAVRFLGRVSADLSGDATAKDQAKRGANDIKERMVGTLAEHIPFVKRSKFQQVADIR